MIQTCSSGTGDNPFPSRNSMAEDHPMAVAYKYELLQAIYF